MSQKRKSLIKPYLTLYYMAFTSQSNSKIKNLRKQRKFKLQFVAPSPFLQCYILFEQQYDGLHANQQSQIIREMVKINVLPLRSKQIATTSRLLERSNQNKKVHSNLMRYWKCELTSLHRLSKNF